MDSKFWDSTVVFWIGMALLLLVLTVHAVIHPRWSEWFPARREFWLRWLSERGPLPLSKLPTVAGRKIPVERYRLAGLIEIEPGADPLIYLSGYGRTFLRA